MSGQYLEAYFTPDDPDGSAQNEDNGESKQTNMKPSLERPLPRARRYEAVESYVDLIAERIVQLGGIAEDAARVATVRSRLEEYPLKLTDAQAHVAAMSRALSDSGREARGTIEEAGQPQDADTADIFTEVSWGSDKRLWFAAAHSQAPK